MFIDEWFQNDFYKKLPLGYHSNYCFGQILWTPAHYVAEDLHLWRPEYDPNEPTRSLATRFNMVGMPGDAYNRSFPLHAPKLEIDEEFVVVRAKRRPVILVQATAPLADISNRGFRRFGRNRVMVAQVFSIVDKKTNQSKYDPSLIERVRRMEFPQLLFLPAFPGGSIPVDSLLRLDETQIVPIKHIEAKQFCLGDDVQQTLKSQIQFLLTGDGEEYTSLREILLAS